MIRDPYIGMPIHFGCSPGTMPGRPTSPPQSNMHPQNPPARPQRPEPPSCISESGFDARLLGSLPLAMAYTPMQQWKTTFSLSEAMQHGTVFPELYLPFEGGMRI